MLLLRRFSKHVIVYCCSHLDLVERLESPAPGAVLTDLFDHLTFLGAPCPQTSSLLTQQHPTTRWQHHVRQQQGDWRSQGAKGVMDHNPGTLEGKGTEDINL